MDCGTDLEKALKKAQWAQKVTEAVDKLDMSDEDVVFVMRAMQGQAKETTEDGRVDPRGVRGLKKLEELLPKFKDD